jgi:methionyl-tRNA formyltransferase
LWIKQILYNQGVEKSLKIIFMGTSPFAVPCLEKLLEARYDICAVVTQPDRPKGRGLKLQYSPVKEKALNYDLNIFQPEKIKEPQAVAYLKSLQPDLMIVVAYGQILSQEILDIPKLGCVNVHGSLLPKYRGAAPIHWAIMNGEKKTGVTTMFMEYKLDSGDILLQDETEISDEDTVEILHDRLSLIGANLLSETVKKLEANDYRQIKQEEELVTYAPLITKDIEIIDWNNTSEKIRNQIRGLNSWPGAYSLYNGKVLKVFAAAIYEESIVNGKVGEIVKVIGNQGFVVKTLDSALLITDLKFEGKKRMDAATFMRGNAVEVGNILGK